MNGYRLLEHTADMGIAAEGDSPAELFRQMALGLRQIISACPDVRPQEDVTVAVEAEGWPELLVNWLGELVFLFETKAFLPAEFEIEEITETGLRARVLGEAFDPNRHFIEREVKAVTYHLARAEVSAGCWHGRVYVDL